MGSLLDFEPSECLGKGHLSSTNENSQNFVPMMDSRLTSDIEEPRGCRTGFWCFNSVAFSYKPHMVCLKHKKIQDALQ